MSKWIITRTLNPTTWLAKKLKSEVCPEFYNEKWIIYFESYLFCPIVCMNLEHAIEVYNQLVEDGFHEDGFKTFYEICESDENGEEADYENTLEGKARFLLDTLGGICGIPWSLADEEFWEDEDVISPKHMSL